MENTSIKILYETLNKISENDKSNIEIKKVIIDVNQLDYEYSSIIFQIILYDSYIKGNMKIENIQSKDIYDFIQNEGSKGVKFNIDILPINLIKMINIFISIIKSN